MNIKEAVATKLASTGETVANRVIDLLVEEVLSKRVNSITSAYTEVDKLKKELNRINPDQIFYNEDGSLSSSTYSKPKLDEKKKISERLERVTKAIDSALEHNNWDLVSKLGDGKSNGENKSNDDRKNS